MATTSNKNLAIRFSGKNKRVILGPILVYFVLFGGRDKNCNVKPIKKVCEYSWSSIIPN